MVKLLHVFHASLSHFHAPFSPSTHFTLLTRLQSPVSFPPSLQLSISCLLPALAKSLETKKKRKCLAGYYKKEEYKLIVLPKWLLVYASLQDYIVETPVVRFWRLELHPVGIICTNETGMCCLFYTIGETIAGVEASTAMGRALRGLGD